jgi:hypothetical protein
MRRSGSCCQEQDNQLKEEAMEGWKKLQSNKTLLGLAIFSSVIAATEGILYHWSTEGGLLKVLLIIENTIKAFTFKPPISLEAAQHFIDADPGLFRAFIGYLYMLVIFIAPYCTFSALYKLISNFLKAGRLVWKGRFEENIVIFGYNGDVRTLIKSIIEKNKAERTGRFSPSRYKISLVSDKELPETERFHYLRNGVEHYEFNIFKAKDSELKEILGEKRLGIYSAKYIFLMDESSMNNFSLLQMLTGGSRDIESISDQIKIFCRCEDDGVLRLIESYYDTPSVDAAGKRIKHRNFDLEIVDVFDLQIWQMFSDTDPHTYYLEKNKTLAEAGKKAIPPEDWKMHLLVLGFGKLGQQAAIQAMNLGVASVKNSILIDVVDYSMEDKKSLFMSRFRPGVFTPERESSDSGSEVFRVNPDLADGELQIRFHSMNVRYGQFSRLLSTMAVDSEGRSLPYTYVVSAIDDTDSSIYNLTELQRFLSAAGDGAADITPVYMRMDSDELLRNYIHNNGDALGLKKLNLIEGVSHLMTIDKIIDDNGNKTAKRINLFYDSMSFDLGSRKKPGAEDRERKSEEKAWQKLTLYQRNSNRASAYHLSTKKEVLKALYGENYKKALDHLFTGDGLYPFVDGAWDYGFAYSDPAGDDVFISKANKDELAMEMLRTEHRRWCYYTLSCGWAHKDGPKDQLLHTNPCLVPWHGLEDTPSLREYCKYDLMPLMAIYEE